MLEINNMTSLHEMKDKGYIPQKMYAKLFIAGAFSLSKTLLFNMGELKKLRKIPPGSQRYIRPKRDYEIPKFTKEMKINNSNEKYLRPTLYCDHREPEVVALAHKLGAYKKSDREFAEAAFELVKEHMILEICPLNRVGETINRGTGTCFHLITAFIALCRAAGIKARYKVFAMNVTQQWYDAMVDPDPLVKKWYDSMGYFMLEGEGEAFIDGKWVVAHVGPEAERQAAAGIAVTKLGEDSIGRWFFAIPGTIMYMESIPYGFSGSTKILKKIAPGSMERVNISIQKQIEKGRKVIEKAGGVEAYDRMVRSQEGAKKPELKIEHKPQIVFED
jgi:hypothetical protein